MACTLETAPATLSSADKADLEIGKRIAAKNTYRKFGGFQREPLDGARDVDPGIHKREPEDNRHRCREENSSQNYLISLGRSYRSLERSALEVIKKINPELANSQDPLNAFARKHLSAEESSKWSLSKFAGRPQPGQEFEVIQKAILELSPEKRADPALRKFLVNYSQFQGSMNNPPTHRNL